MDPITVSLLAVRFANAFVDRAGARSADLVFDYLERRPAARSNPPKALEASIRSEHGFGDLVADAINGDILALLLTLPALCIVNPQ